MHPASLIFLAYGDSSIWDIVIWLIAGAIWLFSQMAAAKKQKARKAQRDAQAQSPAAKPGGGDAPTPAELTEIFKRLGANIPATPPPPAPRPASVSPSATMRKSNRPLVSKKGVPAQVQPELARRLAQAKQEAAAAADMAEAERIALNAIVPGVQSRSGETRALDTATRHTGAILPRLYAMSMRMAPLPTVPMPGFDRTHHVTLPMRTRLHSRREVRDALIAQTFLQPSKGIPH
jgi:hypothetical protein